MSPHEIIELLRRCGKNGHVCEGCPYHYVDDYEAGCGKLLSDAALLLSAAYLEVSDLKITAKGIEVNMK